ncbi:MAG: DUF4965 domain-containing protein [Verrucomicrobiota bacterium]
MNPIGKIFLLTTAALAAFASVQFAGAVDETLRPPAVPLVACDPYFSIWSPADKLTDADTIHWTQRPHRLASLVRIDGKTFRVMGGAPAEIPALPQTGLEVTPTRTIYTFAGEGIQLTLTFMTPVLPDDLMIYSRPVTYVSYAFARTDQRAHQISFQFDANGEISSNDPTQELVPSLTGGQPDYWFNTVRIGTAAQSVLSRKGDDLRIDWGWLYLAGPADQAAASYPSVAVADGKTALILARLDFTSFEVSAAPVARWLMLAYDDEFSIQYFKQNLRPYWRRSGDDAEALLKKSAAEYATLVQRCVKFDAEFLADLRLVGGEKYARLGALAFRQAIAGTKLVADDNGQPLLFPKENTSNGCIGTVDVIYPMSPLFLLFGPSLSKAMLVPALDYASSSRWQFPFAPHDLGTYPLANGQVYGGGERTEQNQMPVEETANLIILTTALAEQEGNADFAAKYWPVLAKWADYLQAKGFDPERQLCTDDFAGHLAHNVNLSAKAIVALGAYGRLCALHGLADVGQQYNALASQFAARWVKEADDGDHFRLAFDQPGTWSQKYNLIWDRVLGLKLFSDEVLAREMAYYPKVMEKFGLSLDNRKPYAELPWSFWTTALTGKRADFDRLLDPIYDYARQTPSRVPFPDFYWTRTAKEAGMHARPVMGGIFICPLLDQAMWHKWASRDTTRSAHWAPFPSVPPVTVVVPAADTAPAIWRFTKTQPPDGWNLPPYDAGAWLEGKSGFGTAGTPGAFIGTVWDSADIWLRREIELPVANLDHLQAWLHHDEDAEVYINGVLALKTSGWIDAYESMALTAAGRKALRPGKNLIAVHCHQTSGGQYIDVGFVAEQPPRTPAAPAH